MSSAPRRRDPQLPDRRSNATSAANPDDGDSSDGGLDAPSSGQEPALSGSLTSEEIVAHLAFALDAVRTSAEARLCDGREEVCTSCGDRFPAYQSRLLAGKCLECFLELNAGTLLDAPGWSWPGVVRALRAIRRPAATEAAAAEVGRRIVFADPDGGAGIAAGLDEDADDADDAPYRQVDVYEDDADDGEESEDNWE
jgi:predicted  nucleic acid-binding Zn-ribbon protein